MPPLVSFGHAEDVERLKGKYPHKEVLQIVGTLKMAQRIGTMTQEKHNMGDYFDNLNILGSHLQGLSEKLKHDLEDLLQELNVVLPDYDELTEYGRNKIARFCNNLPDILISELLR